MPRIVMTLLVRNEADIIAQNVAWHLSQGVDHVIATDNGSTDGTVDALRPFVEDGAVTLLHEPSRDYLQDVWMTRMALMARDEFAADWVFCNDADEFWRAPSGVLHDVLPEAVCGPTMLVCPRHNMIAPRDALGRAHWSNELIFRAVDPPHLPPVPAGRTGYNRITLEFPYFQYHLPPKGLFSTGNLKSIGRGAHTATYTQATPEKLPCSVEIFHYPLRSRDEFERSVRQIGTAVRRRSELSPTISWKYRRWLDLTEASGSIWPAFREALPDRQRLHRDLKAGHLVEDRSMARALDRLAGQTNTPEIPTAAQI